MKVYQIIKEDYDFKVGDSTPSPANVASTASDVAKNAASTAKDAAVSAGTSFSNFYKELGIDTKTLVVGSVAAGITVAGLSKVASKYSEKYAKAIEKNDKLMGFYGKWGKVFTVIGLGVAIAQLYSELAVVEAMYVQGKLPGDDGGREMLEQHREFAFGVFQVQVLTPFIVKFLSRVIGATTLIKWFIRALGGVSVFASMGASIVAIAASEAFTRWLQAWLGSGPGKDFIAKYIFDVIRFTGKPLESFWSDIMGFYKGADVKKYGSEEGAKKASAEREKKKQDNDTGVGSLSGKTAKTGQVNGIVVTDSQGYLLPAIKLMADQELQQARREAIKAGTPDPLAKFPLRPGQKLPEII
jgi:hypothetical protein